LDEYHRLGARAVALGSRLLDERARRLTVDFISANSAAAGATPEEAGEASEAAADALTAVVSYLGGLIRGPAAV
jgi:hypothetical protein